MKNIKSNLLTSAAVSCLLIASPVFANPVGGQIVAGSGTISGENTNKVVVDQKSDKVIIDWRGFSIAKDEITQFNQGNKNAIALNRVTGDQISSILGALRADGQVYLINPNGIIFGSGANIDVAGILATSADISNENFMNGYMRFDIAGKTDAAIVNLGTIKVKDGGVAAFVAPNVRNEGIIQAKLGQVVLGASNKFTLDLAGDNLISFEIGDEITESISGGDSLLNVGGKIDATGGKILLTANAARSVVNDAINVGGVQSAGEVVTNQDGSVSLIASNVSISSVGSVNIDKSVKIDLSAATNGGENGGNLDINGSSLTVDGEYDLSGTKTGGNLNINASEWLSYGAETNASSNGMVRNAAGGNVNLYSGGGMSLSGIISANSAYGNGGVVKIHSVERAIDSASSFIDATGINGGIINYTSDNQIISSGVFRASGTYGTGGNIDITAPRLDLFSSKIYAQGGIQGGRVRIGGEYQGGKGLVVDELANATQLTVTDATIIDVSSIGSRGNGGSAVFWSDDNTIFLGQINALGGNNYGLGGNIEVSSANDLFFDGKIETARNGERGGTLLLDPKNITIADAATSGISQYDLVLQAFNSQKIPKMESGLDASDNLGISVSLDGNRLALGAIGDDGYGNTTSSAGAVYLFTFADSSFSTPTLAGVIGKGYTGGNNYNLSALEASDYFGQSVSLNGNRLAVGAIGDDGYNNSTTDAGAVYSFNFADTSFTTPTLAGIIGKGYTGGNNYNLSVLEASDNFGQSVSINGNRLAVGALRDDGYNNSVTNSGAVYLFSFADALLNTPALEATIGKGYTGGKNFDVSALEANDAFGASVSLEDNRIAIGATGDSGSGNTASSAGAVYLLNFADSSFTTPSLSGIIGKGYTGGNNYNMSSLEAGDLFGSAVSLNVNRLAVGARSDDGYNNTKSNSGAVHLFNVSSSTPTFISTIGNGYTGGQNFNITLGTDDLFGSSVSLNGVRLAAGAYQDDGITNAVSNSGALYLFTFADTSLNTPALAGTIGSGYSLYGYNDSSSYGLQASDTLGWSVSLDGNRLAVSARGDSGAGNTVGSSGAIYLFTFTDSSFSNPSLAGIIGNGYTGGNNYNLTALEGADLFGSAVSLDGNRLAVGAFLDDGYNNSTINAGAVYLFTFADANFSTPNLAGIIGKGYTGGKNYDLSALEANDNFGWSLSLDGNRLAVGASFESGYNNASPYSGAVYLFTFADDVFNTPNLAATIGKGYTGGKNYDLTTLEGGDLFGRSVSLDGNRLAVGAIQDSGYNNSLSTTGAVYLFNFTDSLFSGATLIATIGYGYTGGKNYNVSALEYNDGFGSSVSLNGNRLAVGSIYDDGFGNAVSNSGAVYIFNFDDTAFTAPTLSSIIGKGYTGGHNYDLAALESNDQFGRSVSFDGNNLVIGANGDDGVGNAATDSGAVYFFNTDVLKPSLYTDNASLDLTITPTSIVNILNSGTALTLQANNDINVKSNIIVNNPSGNGGNLTLAAGRSILINANIVTDNGDLSLIANDTLANGVVDAYRASGAAEITFGNGAYINAGSGNVNIEIRNGDGKTNKDSGDINLGSITAGSITAINNGVTAGSGININSGAILTASASGNAVVLSGDGFINNAGSGAIVTPNGRFIVYSNDWDADTRGGLSGNNLYNRTYAANGPSSLSQTGNLFIYKRQPIITIAADDKTREYGLVNPTLTYSYSGLVNGDSASYAFSGSPDLVTSATIGSNVGSYSINPTVGTLSLTDVGYGFSYTAGTLNITKALLTVTADDKTREYGLVNPTLTSTVTGYRNGDTSSVISGLELSTTATQSSNVGSYSITASGASSTNYDFAYNSGTLNITKALLTVTADDKTREYGLVNPTLTSTVTGYRNGDTSSVISGLKLSTTATQSSNVGSYSITASGASSTNYDFAYNSGTLNITKALLTVTADDKTREYGLVNPTLTSTITGYRNGDTSSVISGLKLSTDAVQLSDVGVYSITASGASATNYNFAYNSGKLAVLKHKQTIPVSIEAVTDIAESVEKANLATDNLSNVYILKYDVASNRTVNSNDDITEQKQIVFGGGSEVAYIGKVRN